MHRRRFLILAAALLAGCTSVTKGGGLRYLGNSNDIRRSAQTPEGFAISPQDAAEIVSLFHGPKKTPDDVYCDGECYYVVDGHIKSQAAAAMASAVKVNGQTGQVFDPAQKSWIDVRTSKPQEAAVTAPARAPTRP